MHVLCNGANTILGEMQLSSTRGTKLTGKTIISYSQLTTRVVRIYVPPEPCTPYLATPKTMYPVLSKPCTMYPKLETIYRVP